MAYTEMNFGKDKISTLFRRLFFPTVFGMIFSVILVVTDGIFVGQGLGSDALAAINIVAPLWLLCTGIALMFGMGGSILASISLSHGEDDEARRTLSLSLFGSTLFVSLFSALVMVFPDQSLHLLGCSDRLISPAYDYMLGFIPFMATNSLLISGSFFVRLDGAPKYAMLCAVVASILNIILDYLFIFPLQYGMFGAAIATSSGSTVGTLFIVIYLLKKKHKLHFSKINFGNSARLARKLLKICTLGFPSLLGEMAISFLMLIGNFTFMHYVGEDGVAAFSISCYFFPIIFMLNNAIAQSIQPIISFNYGLDNVKRVFSAAKIGLLTALGINAAITLVTVFFSYEIASMFISPESHTHAITTSGLPLYAIGYVPFALNIIAICYYQSIENSKMALWLTVARGFILIGLCFWMLPILWGVNGIWLSAPAAEITTSIIIALLLLPILIKSNSKRASTN